MDGIAREKVGLVEHNNLKWKLRSLSAVPWCNSIRLSGITLGVLIASMGRRRKEPSRWIQAFIAPSPVARWWFQLLQGIHRTPVYSRFEDAPFLQQEVA